MLDQILNSLAAAGPLALVLGVAVFALWRANAEERIRHAAQGEAERKEFLETLGTVRRDFLSALEHERERHAVEEEKIRAEYVSTLKKFTTSLKESA